MEQTLLVLMKAGLLPLLVSAVRIAQLVVPMQTAHVKTPRSKARSIHLPPLLQSAVPLPQLLVLLEKELLAPLEVRLRRWRYLLWGPCWWRWRLLPTCHGLWQAHTASYRWRLGHRGLRSTHRR